MLRLGSLFSGSGGFELGAMLSGINPIFSAEVEPFPIRVTTKRFPNITHYGDVSKLNGAEVPPVDIITFGSPCQDLSVAGKRRGLDGERSGLFYQAIRIIKEMRNATDGKYPRYIVWENVPGALSSNKGEDFKAVLEALCKIKTENASVPRTETGKWENAGLIMAEGFSLAWRVLDAQYWGVPQRRKRIYLVADFDGQSAGKVLFESEGLSGYSAQGFRAWQSAAVHPASGTGAAGTVFLNDQGGIRMDVTEEYTNTLRAEAHHPPVIAEVPGSVFENHGADARYKGPLSVNPSLTAQYGTGGNNQPLVATDYKDPPLINSHARVRRLMPAECARLQGFPDWWCSALETENPTEEEIRWWAEVFETHRQIFKKSSKPKTRNQIIKWLKNPHSDSAEYKMWGNGVALPCVCFVLSGIVWATEHI